jgi:general secretion pathway protein G
MQRYRIGRVAGFSLIELMVSAAILGILATVAIPLAETTVRRQKERDLKIALREIRNGLDAYKKAASDNRITLQLGQSGYPSSLDDLTIGVPDASNPSGPVMYFLRRIPRDPFYHDSTAPAADTWGKRSFASSAENPQEGDDVYDVHSLSTETGLNGVPYREW